MSDIDPKILEFGRREFGENCELVKRTEWSYSFKYGEKSHGRISRFMAEPGFEVRASEIRRRWPTMNEHERLDFASNFQSKPDWTENDSEILEVIMWDGSDLIWSSCALAIGFAVSGRCHGPDCWFDGARYAHAALFGAMYLLPTRRKSDRWNPVVA